MPHLGSHKTQTMRHFKNPYADFSGGGDPRDPYPDDAVKDDLERLLADIVSNAESFEGNYSSGIYVGPAGVAFALWYVSTLRKQCRDPGSLMKVARRYSRFFILIIKYYNVMHCNA